MKFTFLTLVTAATLGWGCSQPASPTPAAATPSQPVKSTPEVRLPIPGPSQERPADTVGAGSTSPSHSGPPLTAAQEAQRIKQVEQAYAAETGADGKQKRLFELTEAGTKQALEGMTRLFRLETDPELKQQMLDALVDFDDLADLKLTLLKDAIRPTQPLEVREAGIAAFAVLNDQRGIPILQGLLADPAEPIRAAAKIVIGDLQAGQPAS